MRILLVEDDQETAAYIAQGLREHGHVVDTAANGQDGLFLATGGTSHDVLVIDRMLPGLDGLGLVRALRETGVKVPVLFLTALGGVGDRVRGLEAGGDDYLVKPFAFAELMARLQALARRPPLSDVPTRLVVGDLERVHPSDMLRLIDRFYRAERSRTTPGNGLGLSLVAAVADLHEAALHIETNAPGLRVRMAFRTSSGMQTSENRYLSGEVPRE